MRKTGLFCSLLSVVAVLVAAEAKPAAIAKPIPELRHVHGATQLFVDGRPFLIQGGELDNSSPSSAAYMKPIWPRLKAMGMNTAILPAYWELIEKEEGKFDFSSVDVLIENARKNNMRVVLLWFGSWKNSMSSYAPAWVKRDVGRFPRVRTTDGKAQEILSPMSEANLEADCRAFKALMSHIKKTDSQRTVIVVQPENEVGMIPEARDHSPEANAAFAAPVPKQLTDYLVAHRGSLVLSLRDAWESHGAKTGASWEETFGAGLATDEIFNAWTQALYSGKVAAAGKAVYPLPMYANAALIRPGKQPGQYPSGGPLPQVFDVWKAAAPALDFLAPDLYFPNFVEWATKYAKPGNPLFIPETGRVSAAEMAANGYWAYGHLNAIAFSPYAPEFLSKEEQEILGQANDLLLQIAPQILAAQGTSRIAAVRTPFAFDGTQDTSAQKIAVGDYVFDVHFKNPPPISIGQREEVEMPGAHGGIIIQSGPEEYLVAGTGMNIYFQPADGKGVAGIESIWEGRYVNGVWVPGRCLNGDESNQGRQLKVPSGRFELFRVRLYRYQ
jgi:beta-galactosidase GanA